MRGIEHYQFPTLPNPKILLNETPTTFGNLFFEYEDRGGTSFWIKGRINKILPGNIFSVYASFEAQYRRYLMTPKTSRDDFFVELALPDGSGITIELEKYTDGLIRGKLARNAGRITNGIYIPETRNIEVFNICDSIDRKAPALISDSNNHLAKAAKYQWVEDWVNGSYSAAEALWSNAADYITLYT